ncbi:unnamed protein product [Polarella glacialis]|uniref:Uncharacterized protein n=1 Tax=Polarella glacialis TaxID=89957 RepID=A0A813GKG4_POLGL|nr:unnamed protein product [Polarella glacialis]
MAAAAADRPRKLLVAGDALGNVAKLFGSVETQASKVGGFDALLCAGAFLAEDGGAGSELAAYVKGSSRVPVPCYFVDSSPALLQAAPGGRQMCENLHFLGGYGLRDICGLRVGSPFVAMASRGRSRSPISGQTPIDAEPAVAPADGAATPPIRFADDEDRELFYQNVGRVVVPQQTDNVNVASSQIAPTQDPVPQSDTQEIITGSGFHYSMPSSTSLPSPEDLRQAEEDWHNHAEIRAEFYRNWNPPQHAEEIVQTDIKTGADPSPAQVAWLRDIANKTLPVPVDWSSNPGEVPGNPSSSTAGATGSPAAAQGATGPDVAVGPDAPPAQCATGLYGVGPDAPPREAVGRFSCIWTMEEDVAAAYERFVMNSTNLDCVGISEPKSLLFWCVDIWLAIAGRRIEARISQTAKNVMKEIIRGIPSEVARLDLANAWRTNVHDAVSISRHELPLRDTADDMMTSALKDAGIEEALWFFPRWEAQNVDSDTDLFLFATDTKTPIEPLRKKSRKDRKRFNKPVLSLMAGESFVNVVAPIEFEDSPANNQGSSSGSYLGGSWSTGNLSSEGEGSQSYYVHVKLKGGPAPDVQKGFVKARIEEVDGQKAVMGKQVNGETVDKSCPSARWLLTNIIGFHWPVDRICFKMATQCSIAEITALTTPLMKQLESMTQIEKETSDPGNSLGELLSFYLARRKLVNAAMAINLPYATASKDGGASTWSTGGVGSSKPLVGRTGSSEEDYKHVCPNCLTPRSLIQAVCLMCSSKDKAVPRTVEDFVITVGANSWKMDVSSGSPGWIFISSAPADEQVDINSSYQIPLGGLGRQPVSCSSSNMADGAMSYCDLDRERGRQRRMAEYTGDEEGVVFQEEKIDEQEAFGFHPVLVEAHGAGDLAGLLLGAHMSQDYEDGMPRTAGNDLLKHANIEDMLKMFWDVKGSTSIGGRVLAAAKTDIESSKAVATRANEIDASLGFDSKGTFLRFSKRFAWEPHVRRSIESGDLNPLGTASLLSHEEILSSIRSYVVACKCMSLNSFSGKLFQEVPALLGTASNQSQFEQPSPLGVIHYLLHSNKCQMRLSDAEWVLMPGPLDEDAASVSWQKYIGKDWGDYAEIESITRGLGDAEGRGQMSWQNNFDQRQIEEEILSGKRLTALPNSPLVGIYRKDPASWHFERKIAYWDLPGLFHRHGSSHTAKQLFDYWNNLVVLKKTRGRSRKTEAYVQTRTDKWLENKKFCNEFLQAHGYDAPTTHSERSMLNKHIGMFLASTHFLARNPSFVMQLPPVPGHDGKDQLRWRAQFDERLTVPIEAFPFEVRKYFKNSLGRWAQVEQFYRCNTKLYWLENVEDAATVDEGATGPGIVPRAATQQDGGSKFEAKRPPFMMKENTKYHCEAKKRSADGKKQFWNEAECGLILLASSQWEMKVKSPEDRLDLPLLQWRVVRKPGRMEYFTRFEPNEPCRDVPPTLADAPENRRVRFSGIASNTIWEILYTDLDLGTIVELDRLAAMSVTGRRVNDLHAFPANPVTSMTPSGAFTGAQGPEIGLVAGRGSKDISTTFGVAPPDNVPGDLKTRPPTTMTETTSSPSAIPVAYEANVALLHSDARRILDQYSIPYSLQAKLAVAGYVTVDDLSCRWNTPELARSNGEADLDFSPTQQGWDQRSVGHTCMRLFQAVRQAQAVQTAAADAPSSSGQRDGVVLQAGKRASLEENYKKVTGSRPPLQEQGSDAFLSAQFKLCEKGEIGFFHTKQTVSAMPDPLEMAATVKGLKPVNGFLYQEDQEERKSPYSKEQWESVLTVFQTNLLMCVWAFPNNRLFDLEKSDMDSFYKFLLGDEIAKRSPAPELKVLMHAERAAWRKVALHTHEGLSLKTSLDKVRSNSLFWTREVYEKVESGPKGKGKDKGKAKAAWLAKNGKQEWYPNYEAVKEEGKGRLAALMLRLLYYMFPGLDWAFVYVDDFAFLLRRRWANKLAWALLATMAALGCPLVMVALLRDITDGKRFSYDEIAEGLGRLQWATNAFPLVKPFLQPFWAWKTAVVTASFPSRLLRMIAKVILLLINSVITSASPFCPTSSTHGATDAGADDTTATIGGWFSDLQNPRQVDVSWFFVQLTKDNAPWAFGKSSPQRRIAALEMFGALLLFRHLAQEDKIGGHSVYIPLLTDNQGNALSILNHRTKKWPCSPILMELVLQAHVFHTPIAIRHVKRDFNIWADALTNSDFWGFCPAKEIVLDISDDSWLLLPKLMLLGKHQGA